MLPCYFVGLLACHYITLLLCTPVTLLPSVTMLQRNKAVADLGEGPGGPAPPYFGKKNK